MFLIAIASAFWLGVLTSISPCPLATNVAAISYVGGRAGKTRAVLFAGAAYTVGRALAYALLGTLLLSIAGLVPALSHALQKYMNMLLGPLLILVGMVLLDMISFSVKGCGLSGRFQKRVENSGIWGAGLLGIVFALSFCPTSAALFFGSLLPLAVYHHSGIVLPAVYGIATGLPVMVFAILLAFGGNMVARAFSRVSVFEVWARKMTGMVFLAVGVYYCLTHIFALEI